MNYEWYVHIRNEEQDMVLVETKCEFCTFSSSLMASGVYTIKANKAGTWTLQVDNVSSKAWAKHTTETKDVVQTTWQKQQVFKGRHAELKYINNWESKATFVSINFPVY